MIVREQPLPLIMDKQKKEPTWTAIRDLFDQIIVRAKNWQDAEIIATPEDMADHFQNAFPDVNLWPSDIPLALHDLNIPFERNENNNKFYYLARWRPTKD